MSPENVEIVRRSFEAFARGDFESALAEHDPGSEWCTAADEPDRRTYRRTTQQALEAVGARG